MQKLVSNAYDVISALVFLALTLGLLYHLWPSVQK